MTSSCELCVGFSLSQVHAKPFLCFPHISRILITFDLQVPTLSNLWSRQRNHLLAAPSRPEFRFNRSNKTPKGHQSTWKKDVKKPEVSPKVTMGGMQTQVSTVIDGTPRPPYLTLFIHGFSQDVSSYRMSTS